MKLFALLFAFLTVACAIDALILPAFAQQTVRSIPPSAMKGVSTTPAPVTNTDLQPTQTPVTEDADEPPAADEERPPPVRVIWGGQGLPRFRGVVDSVEEKYTMFSTDGAPVRAAAEADASKSKSGDGASVQAPTARDQQTYRPAEFRTAPLEDDDEDDDSD
jgi:hypothetical protein